MSDWQAIAEAAPITVLYTCLDGAAVLGDQSQAPGQAVMLAVGDRWLEVEPGSQGYGTVRRLISGNPQDYLHPAWQPGARVWLGGGA